MEITQILRRSTLKPVDLMFIGDDAQDVNLAKSAGIDVVRIVRNGKRPEGASYVCIFSLEELT